MPLLQHLLRSPQTYLLLVGLGLGYGGLLHWQGTRPVVWVCGGAIALITLAAWIWQNRPQPQLEGATDNLLDPVVFRERLKIVERQLPNAAQPEWTQAQSWALQIQQSAESIAQREPSLTPDLLEALHTVLDLSGQVAGALQVTQKIQTESYRQLAQEQLAKSSDRLRETWTQMQQLQDQLALSALEQQAAQTEPLPAQLRLLITHNKTTLQTSDHPPAL
ncbi:MULTISPECIES: hypothetical protein [unclassified Leptolyngbya]|uniref:hypothetical protein n=1 Tax=unclassified Leptolyngbya TaxID=2650499 RepID=UPI001689B9F0|nr:MULTISPECIES: hypothetical protein [unclassified Leptolyngbya]MBD1912934.1 hypothetical protein [Leptolyngbya sp. FACHB-8]MBD2154737.1 hypothetical protein [Leptolyngbya sp. FACHB-16]